MSKNKGRDLIVLDEFLTDKELDLSDFDGVDFKKQTTAIVELFTNKKPKLLKCRDILTENHAGLSSKIWGEDTPIEDLTMDQCFIRAIVPDDSSLIAEKAEFSFIWKYEDTTEQTQLWEKAINNAFYKALQEVYGFENIPKKYQLLKKMDPEETCLTKLTVKRGEKGKGKGEDKEKNKNKNKNKSDYIESIEKVIPPVDSPDDQYVTVTILIPSPHELGNVEIDGKRKVSKSVPEWTFHHINFTNKQSLALRLFVALECLGMSASGIGGDGCGVWTTLVSQLKLPVTSQIAKKKKEGQDEKKNYTLFQDEEKTLRPQFKGKSPHDVQFKSRSYTEVIATENNEKNKKKMDLHIKELTVINEMALTVGLVMLTIGNFLGGMWANESWGRYWGWDPKETWALISIMVYAFVLHMRLIPGLRGRYTFNLWSIIAFASIMMTYFGVNFYLSGLHSYASGDKVITPTSVYYSIAFVSILGVLAWVKNKKYYKK